MPLRIVERLEGSHSHAWSQVLIQFDMAGADALSQVCTTVSNLDRFGRQANAAEVLEAVKPFQHTAVEL